MLKAKVNALFLAVFIRWDWKRISYPRLPS